MTDRRSYYRQQALANYAQLYPGQNPTILTANNEAGAATIFVVASATGELILEHEGTSEEQYGRVLAITESLLSEHIGALRAGNAAPETDALEGLRRETEGWKNEVDGWKNEVAGWKRENEGLKRELEVLKAGHPANTSGATAALASEVQRLAEELDEATAATDRLRMENAILRRASSDAASHLWVKQQADTKGKEVAALSELELEWTPVPSDDGDGVEYVTYKA